eukprot:6402526-Amphidinium_carterae.1
MLVQSADNSIKQTNACEGLAAIWPQMKKNFEEMRMQPPTTASSRSRPRGTRLESTPPLDPLSYLLETT